MLKTVSFVLVLAVLGASSVVFAQTGMQDPIRKAIAEGQFEEARENLEGDAHGRHEAERLELLTEACNGLGDYAAAIRYGKQAIAKSPESTNAYFQYAVAVRTKMQQVSRVKAMFTVGTYKKALRRARKLDPQNLDAREEEIGFLTQAPSVAGGDVDRARELALELKALHAQRGLVMEIEIETQKGDPGRALALFREALDADPDNHALRNRFAFHLQQEEKFREADAEFEALLSADNPQLAQGALYQRARTRILGRYEQDKAVRFLQQYVEKMTEGGPRLPSRSSAYWRMGNAHEQLQQIAEARVAYTKALELDRDNDSAKKALKALPR